MKINHNKLVRDKIPEIILATGKTPKVCKLDGVKFYNELNKKLLEEVQEFIEADNIEELADIMEVLDAILEKKGISYEEVRDVQRAKREKRGGFKEGIFLQWVEE